MEIVVKGFTKHFGDTTVIENMNLTVKDGEMLALLGPSGCGKSTTLFAICGIHKMDAGQVLFGDRDVTHVPAQQRNVGMVFQSYALYPHMTVFQNIAFPLTVRGESKVDIKRKVIEIADLVYIGELLERRPAQLSGGQQQRVSLARALIRRPGVLMLDEPLANLDARLRLEMRSELRRIQQETGIAAILVTHDQVEAMSICDRIAIMDQGKILQIATPAEMYQRPVNSFVAGFLGDPPISFLDGVVRQGILVLQGDADETIPLPEHISGQPDGKVLRLGVRPEHYQPHFPTKIKGVVVFVEMQGREILFDVKLSNGDLLRSVQAASSHVKLGDTVEWGVDPAQILVFDDHGTRL